MEDNHTPTPWKLIRGTKEKLSKIKKGKYTLELQGYGYQQKKEIEDAEFIVTACNNYQALKEENEEYKKLLEKLREKMQFEDFFTDEFLDIDNLLTKHSK